MKKINSQLTYYDDDGNIYSVDFIQKEDINSLGFEEFINEVVSSNLDLLSCKIKDFSTNKLIESFRDFDIKSLNSLYITCKNISGDADNICDIILKYFMMFFECKSNMFCTYEEASAFIVASIRPMFVNQDSEVIRNIENANRGYLINDILNKNVVSKNLVKSISR